MLTFAEISTQYHMYQNQILNDFIINLESRYTVKNETEFFNNLVNFSKNVNVPIHNWFKYREGYSNKLVNELLIRYPINKDQIVLDPFCGSGTTLLEAGTLGYRSIGIDANPMSVEISNAKSTLYSDEEIIKAKEYLSTLNRRDLFQNSEQLAHYEDIQGYFHQDYLLELLNINDFIQNSISEPKIIMLFRAGYLSIIEECSNRKRDGNGLKSAETKVQSVKFHFILKMEDILTEVASVKITKSGKAFWGTATNMKEQILTYCTELNQSIGSIIFSPPYANSFDYFESYKMELRLGGFIEKMGKNGLSPFRELAVRSFVTGGNDEIEADEYLTLLALEIEQAIPLKEEETGKKDERTRKVPKMIKGYFSDMANALAQCYEVLDTNGHCSIVVDQSSYLGKIIPTDLLLAYYGEQIGFTVKEIIICRQAKTSSQQMNKYPYLRHSLRESIVVLEK